MRDPSTRKGDDVDMRLWEHALAASFTDLPRAYRALHLAEGYRAGVDLDEILERIAKGELDG